MKHTYGNAGQIPVPSGRLHANQMVAPSTRDGITDNVRSQIVPTLIRQER